MSGAGDLYHRVAWDKPGGGSDGHGGRRSAFVEQFQTRAGFTPLRGSEAVIASRLEGRQPIVVRVRATSQTRQITPDWRMRDVRKETEFAVRSIAETKDRLWLDVMVEEGVAA